MIAVYLRQPLIVVFIVVGLLIGPSAFDWVQSHDQIDLLAQIKACYNRWKLSWREM